MSLYGRSRQRCGVHYLPDCDGYTYVLEIIAFSARYPVGFTEIALRSKILSGGRAGRF